jgi:hypothetical protein
MADIADDYDLLYDLSLKQSDALKRQQAINLLISTPSAVKRDSEAKEICARPGSALNSCGG